VGTVQYSIEKPRKERGIKERLPAVGLTVIVGGAGGCGIAACAAGADRRARLPVTATSERRQRCRFSRVVTIKAIRVLAV